MSRKNGVAPIPQGFQTITAAIVVKDAAKAIEFYSRAFGAKELFRIEAPGGQGIVHAELQVGSSILMISDECSFSGTKSPLALGGTSSSIHLYVEDVDAVFRRALAAGATVKQPVLDVFWGDRYGKIADPYGHVWGIATHVEDVAPAEMDRRAQEFFASAANAPVHAG